MRRLIDNWYEFATRKFMLLNVVLMTLVVFSAWSLRTVKFDADWLSLFSAQDPVIANYKEVAGVNSNLKDIYIRTEQLVDHDALSLALKKVPEISSITELPNKADTHWYKISLVEESAAHIERLNKVLADVERNLIAADIKYAITGGLKIIEEFNQSIETDFVLSSGIAMVLLMLSMLWLLGRNIIIIYGFFIQICGLVVGTYIYSLFYPSVNVIAAALPAVLLGLGVDFVIHILTHKLSRPDEPSIDIYKYVASPMFWGALTTAGAFVSLCFTELSGLRPAGVFGAINLMVMYATIILFVPPACSLFPKRKAHGLISIKLPFLNTIYSHKKMCVFVLFMACCGYFSTKVKFEDNVENLYSSNMKSIVVQKELAASLGVQPAPLFLAFHKPVTLLQLAELQKSKLFVLADFRPNNNTFTPFICTLYAKKDPFDPRNYKLIEESIATHLPATLRGHTSLTGDPLLCNHLNKLLFRGMVQAFVVITLLIFIIVWVKMKRIKYAFACLLTLLLSCAVTFGLFGLFDVRLSAYTLTLLPLFMGIGVDDCLHIMHYSITRRRKMSSDTRILKAVFLTTITTVFGYGSLVLASNGGFRAMGIAAAIGLVNCFLFAVYFLPLFLPKSESNILEDHD